MKTRGVWLVVVAALWCGPGSASTAMALEEPVTYEDDVLPIFRNHCLSCHNTDKKRADLDLSVYSAMLEADVVAPADLDESLLFQLITHADEPRMPPKQPKMPASEIATIRRWIESGLVERSGAKALKKAASRVIALADAPSGRPAGPPCLPVDALLEPVVRTEKPGTVRAVATAPWAPIVAVGGAQQVLIYHLETRDLMAVLPFPEGTPYTLRFSRSGTLLVAGGGRGGHSGRAVVWDVASSRRVCEVGAELDAVLAVDISPDHTEVALGGASKVVKVYSTATGEELATLRKHAEWVTAIEYSPDGVLLASADRGAGLFVWESFSRQLFHDLRGSGAAITGITWRRDSNVLASCDESGEAFLWSMESGAATKKWKAHGGGATSIAFGPDGRLVTAGRDKLLKTWRGDGKGIQAHIGLADVATSARFDESGKRVVGADLVGNVAVFGEVGLEGTIRPNPPTVAERTEQARVALAAIEAELVEPSAAFDAARERAVLIEAQLTEQTIERDAAASVLDGAKLRAERADALVTSIDSAIAAAEALGVDGVDTERLVAGQRELRESAVAIQSMARSEAEASSQRLADLEDPLDDVRREHAAAQSALAAARDTVEGLRRRQRQARAALAKWRAAAINVERYALRDALDEAERSLEPILAERALAAEALAVAERKVAARQQELVGQSVRRTEAVAAVDALTAEIAAASVELGALAKASADKAALIDTARALVARIQRDAEGAGDDSPLYAALRSAEETVTVLTADHDEAQRRVEVQGERVAELDGERANARAGVAAVDERTSELPLLIEAAEEERARQRETLAKAEARVVAQQRAIDAARVAFTNSDGRYRAALAGESPTE